MDNVRVLNNMTPGSARAGLGDINAEFIASYNALLAAHNALVTKFNAVLAKLDTAGATVTGLGTDYVSTQAASVLANASLPDLNDR